MTNLPQHNNFWKNNVLWQKKIRWHLSATIFFSATTHYFLRHNTLFFQKKYCVVASLSQHITFWVTTHYFSKDIVLCAMSATQYFLKKNNVLWQTYRNTLFFQKKILCCGHGVQQHSIFWCCDSKSNVVMCCDKLDTTQYFLKK